LLPVRVRGLLAAWMTTADPVLARTPLPSTRQVRQVPRAEGKGDGAAAKTMKLTVGDLTNAERMAGFSDAG